MGLNRSVESPRYGLDVTTIATPIEHCVCVALGPLDPDVVARLKASQFDQAPVVAERSLLGIIETTHAEKLLAAGLPLLESDEALVWTEIGPRTSIDYLLEVLAERRATLIVEEGDVEGHHLGRCAGLVTISDLNRHEFRRALYALLAELEAQLARLLQRCTPDHRDWLKSLREDQQARLLGYWELSKIRGVDIGVLAASTLTELLKIAGVLPAVRGLLGFPSRNKFDEFVGALPDVRNKIMHPVRPLVLGREEVAALRPPITAMAYLIERLTELERTTPS